MDNGLKKGDIAHVVLDCIPVDRDDGPHRRVIVRGVYPAGSELPAPYENGTRNVVDVFIGLDMQVPAFLIAYPREGEGGHSGA
jgi:hypothetical protein